VTRHSGSTTSSTRSSNRRGRLRWRPGGAWVARWLLRVARAARCLRVPSAGHLRVPGSGVVRRSRSGVARERLPTPLGGRHRRAPSSAACEPCPRPSGRRSLPDVDRAATAAEPVGGAPGENSGAGGFWVLGPYDRPGSCPATAGTLGPRHEPPPAQASAQPSPADRPRTGARANSSHVLRSANRSLTLAETEKLRNLDVEFRGNGRLGKPYYRLPPGRVVPGMENACRPAFGAVKIGSRTGRRGTCAVPAECAAKPVTDLWTYSQQIHGPVREARVQSPGVQGE
jgi:hypothetical protein